MARQLAFDLPIRTARGRDAFFVSEANARAVAQVDDWARWPNRRLVLVGPEGAGKTHLAEVWASRVGARRIEPADLAETFAGITEADRVIVEHADRIAGSEAETLLLHLINRLAARGALLFTAETPPARWKPGLPDLSSRLEASGLATLGDPDDALLGAVLLKLFADRQIAPPPELVPYLVHRIERSFRAAGAIVAALDAESLARRQPIGIRLAGQLLDAAAIS